MPQQEKAILAAGCFWGVEHKFRQTDGIIDTRVGYIGGHTENPSYKDVCYNDTGHAEAVEITYDPAIISYEQILKIFFDIHDPTQKNRQGPDVGDQYRSAIFTLTPDQRKTAEEMIHNLEDKNSFPKTIQTLVTPAQGLTFYEAEEYHQRYIEKQHGIP